MSNANKTEGAEAFDGGAERHECPYLVGTEQFDDWTDGWAQRKAQREKDDAMSACTIGQPSVTAGILQSGYPGTWAKFSIVARCKGIPISIEGGHKKPTAASRSQAVWSFGT